MSENLPNEFLLFLVSRAHHNLANKVFGEIGLCRGQPAVLKKLGRKDGITQTELAEKLEITQATLTRLLTRVETSGLIERQRDSKDSRCSRIFLTKNGKNKLVEIVQMINKIDRIAFAGFSEEEKTELNGFLVRIHKNLGSDNSHIEEQSL